MSKERKRRIPKEKEQGNKFFVREYQPQDRSFIIECMENLWDYLSDLDDLKRMTRKPEYGEVFTQKLLKEVTSREGIIYIASEKEKNIAFIAGTILKQTEEERLAAIPHTDGRVNKLFIKEKYRKKGVGKLLMEKMEEYFKSKDCDLARVEVFDPNVDAHAFYEKLGYRNRVIDMVKRI